MPRAWVWLQVLSGWLPVWALYTALIVAMHQPVTLAHAGFIGVRAILPAALLGVFVHRLAAHVPWPQRSRLSFALLHLGAAAGYAVGWMLLVSVVESIIRWQVVLYAGAGIAPFLVLGVWLYVIVAGISDAIEATERAARAEATTARMQLAALRAQLHPHFLFNALHTVVQLIPTEPTRAADAAEQVALLLRTTVEEDRDIVSLQDEWSFVSRYLDLERIRFGDRLRVHADIAGDLLATPVPSFALQTLVENAVRHGAAPRVAPTDITVTATGTDALVRLRVHDTGDGASTAQTSAGGTGLSRLRERLAALYGGTAKLLLETGPAGGFAATLVIPRAAEETG
ncbi:MAG: sensor protein lytS [Gemmatimonadetes bacterium]|nr:sensor protein lytS [Gemmatimonadota bacterium]